MPRELDVVRFDVSIGDWPAGTTGTVVEGYRDGGTVEIDNSITTGIELVTVDYQDVTVIWSATESPVAVES
jgi:hypothetical protein